MRTLCDTEDLVWRAEIISQGRSSPYLSGKVHRPIVQFSCLDRSRPRRYAPLPARWDTLDQLDDRTLLSLLAEARPH